MAYTHNDLPIFTQWFDFLKWLLPTVDKFPKRVRFTFGDRISNHALSIAETLVEARYSQDKQPLLRQVNMHLEKIRILLRLAHELHYLSYKAYEFSIKKMNEVGKMLGGWLRQQQKKP